LQLVALVLSLAFHPTNHPTVSLQKSLDVDLLAEDFQSQVLSSLEVQQ
jgi:hypothetical protein